MFERQKSRRSAATPARGEGFPPSPPASETGKAQFSDPPRTFSGDARAKPRRPTVKGGVVRLVPDPNELRTGGTAFFVSPDLALTAFHNIEHLVDNNVWTVDWFDEDESRFTFEILDLLPRRLLELYDIAPLRIIDIESGKGIDFLTPARFDPCTQRNQEAQQYFASRSVIVRGFPNTHDGYRNKVETHGQLAADQAIQDIRLSRQEDGQRVELVFSTNSVRDLPGLSGAPIIDQATGWVIGVLQSYISHPPEDQKEQQPGVVLMSVYGAPLGLLAERMPEFAKLCEMLPPEPPKFCARHRHSCILAVALTMLVPFLLFLQWEQSEPPPPCKPVIEIAQPKNGELTGSVVGCNNPAQFVLAVFVRVNGQWWVKPTAAERVIEPASDGQWRTHIVTGGLDEQATEIRVYLLPRDRGLAWAQEPIAPWEKGWNELPASFSVNALVNKILTIEQRR